MTSLRPLNINWQDEKKFIRHSKTNRRHSATGRDSLELHFADVVENMEIEISFSIHIFYAMDRD